MTCRGITFNDAFKVQWQNTVYVTALGDTVFWQMCFDVTSEQMVIKFDLLMMDSY